jgi:hypothetical protein
MQNRASARPGKSKPQGRSGQRAGKKAGCDIIRQFRSEARAARKNSENHTGGRRLAWQAARRPFGSSCDSHVPWRARLARRLRGTNRRDVTVSQHHAHGRSRRQSLTARRSRQAQPFAISFWKTHRQVVRSSGSNEPPHVAQVVMSSCRPQISLHPSVTAMCCRPASSLATSARMLDEDCHMLLVKYPDDIAQSSLFQAVAAHRSRNAAALICSF